MPYKVKRTGISPIPQPSNVFVSYQDPSKFWLVKSCSCYHKCSCPPVFDTTAGFHGHPIYWNKNDGWLTDGWLFSHIPILHPVSFQSDFPIPERGDILIVESSHLFVRGLLVFDQELWARRENGKKVFKYSINKWGAIKGSLISVGQYNYKGAKNIDYSALKELNSDGRERCALCNNILANCSILVNPIMYCPKCEK